MARTPAEEPSAFDSEEDLEERVGHPKGTLVIVGIYGLLFALGWAALYTLQFMPRGAPGP